MIYCTAFVLLIIFFNFQIIFGYRDFELNSYQETKTEIEELAHSYNVGVKNESVIKELIEGGFAKKAY